MQTDALYQKLFSEALLIRMVEEAIIEHYPSDKIQSPVHLSIGQEAVAVGVCQALDSSDWLFSTYRSHAFYLAKGGSLNAMMAELYGKKTGCCGGKGGSMHLSAPEVGFMGTSAVVASSISNAVGAALAKKLTDQDGTVVCVFGDGATEEGCYHESLNLASVKQIPVLFICENNGYAVHANQKNRQSYNLAEHANSYGIETQTLPCTFDFCDIFAATQKAKAYVQTNQKPFFLEINTFRAKEHVGPGDDFDAPYRDLQARQFWLDNDPLLNDKESFSRWHTSLESKVADALEYADKSPLPEQQDLYTDVL